MQCLLIQGTIWNIVILVFLAILTLITIVYLFKTYRLRVWNPIQELSPYLTITQGFALYGFVAFSLIVLINNSNLAEFRMIKCLMIFQNYFRGLFIVVTIFKSLRITIAFQLNPESRNCMKKVCYKLFNSEFKLAFLSLILTGTLWTGLFYIVQLGGDIYSDQQNMSDIIQYEQLNTVEALNNVVEVVLCLFIVYWNEKIKIPQFDALKQYISNPLIIYSIWLYLNTFLNYAIKGDACQGFENKLPISFLIMLISQILRCMVEFYYIIFKPIQNSTYIRLPLIPSAVLGDFQLFMRIPLCSTVFYKYCQTHLFDSKILFLEFEDNLKVLEAWMYFQMNKENSVLDSCTMFTDLAKRFHETEYQLNNQEQILIRLEKHIGSVFKSFKQTKSFQFLNQLFCQLDNATRNFYELNIIQNFLN